MEKAPQQCQLPLPRPSHPIHPVAATHVPLRAPSMIKEALKRGNVNEDERFQQKADRSHGLGSTSAIMSRKKAFQFPAVRKLPTL